MFVYFNLLNSNEYFFLYINKSYNTSLTKMIQRTNNNHNKSLK